MVNVYKGHPNIFVRSDDHFDHEFMIRGMVDEFGVLLPGARIPRPMFSSVEEMNEIMIQRHNERVKPGDRVYELGDFCVRGTLEKAMGYRKRMNGQWFALEGNHDEIAAKMAKLGAFEWFRQQESISLGQPYFDQKQKQLIVLNHYAMTVWNKSHHASWQLYGHSHGMLPESPYTCSRCGHEEAPYKLQFDCGVDSWDFYPVSIDEIKAKMALKMPAWLAHKERIKGTGRAE